MESELPLKGLLILDLSQFLSGPYASLRLADLGARVIKIERSEGGDLCRRLYISEVQVDEESTLFHCINRNKESFAADLKNADQLAQVRQLVSKCDVLIQNFRPGIMERYGLGYKDVQELNPGIVYASVTGYGEEGPWKGKPGQDLLAQSLSGLTWLSGDANQGPVPMGLAIADMFAGAHLAQGILACLVRRGKTGKGGMVQVSLLESILDFQFEVFTTYLNDGGKLPQRSVKNSAHAYLGAPYGIYKTKDGYIALAMGSVTRLGELIDCQQLQKYSDPSTYFTCRDEIKELIAQHLTKKSTAEWLAILEPADIWCSDVFDWDRLVQHEGFRALQMVQTVERSNGTKLKTTRCPIRINGEILLSSTGSPRLGEHNSLILEEISTLDGMIESSIQPESN